MRKLSADPSSPSSGVRAAEMPLELKVDELCVFRRNKTESHRCPCSEQRRSCPIRQPIPPWGNPPARVAVVDQRQGEKDVDEFHAHAELAPTVEKDERVQRLRGHFHGTESND